MYHAANSHKLDPNKSVRVQCAVNISLTIMLSHKAMPLVTPDDSAVITFAHGKCRQGCGAQL